MSALKLVHESESSPSPRLEYTKPTAAICQIKKENKLKLSIHMSGVGANERAAQWCSRVVFQLFNRSLCFQKPGKTNFAMMSKVLNVF